MNKYFLFNGLSDNGENRPKRVTRLFLQHGDNPNLELIDEISEGDILGLRRLKDECERLNQELERDKEQQLEREANEKAARDAMW